MNSCLCGGQTTAGCSMCNPIKLKSPLFVPDNGAVPTGFLVQRGWECPRCSRIYSPVCLECSHCNNAINARGAT